jgi:hypothetical protein
MSPALAQREIALAGVALLGAILALVLTSHGDHAKAQGLLQPLTFDGGRWRADLAGATPVQYGRRTNCSIVLRPSTIGVTDSVLPCGVKLYLAYGDSPEILTQVIERRPVKPGRKFELTPRLAETLGIDGVQEVRWAFAGVRSS